jgi:phage terminase small subunit
MSPKSSDVSKNDADLSQKQQVFIREYLVDGNATRAAIAAGYGKKSAAVSASRLLRNAKVAAELERLQKKHLDELEFTDKMVLRGLGELAFFDPRKLFNSDGTLKKITELEESIAHAITGMDVEKLFRHFGKGQSEEVGTITKIRFADRGLNLERLGRHFKMFTDKLELTDGHEIVKKLQEGRARAAARKKA